MKQFVLRQLDLLEEFAPIGFEKTILDIKAFENLKLEVTTIIINDEPMADIKFFGPRGDMLFWRAMDLRDTFKAAKEFIDEYYNEQTNI